MLYQTLYQTLGGIRDIIYPTPPKTLAYWLHLATVNKMPCWKQRKRFSTSQHQTLVCCYGYSRFFLWKHLSLGGRGKGNDLSNCKLLHTFFHQLNHDYRCDRVINLNERCGNSSLQCSEMTFQKTLFDGNR